MNIEEYISSGILEAYILEELSPKESKDVELKAAAYPEIRSELEMIEETLFQAAQLTSVPAPDHLKSNILNSIPDGHDSLSETKVISINNSTWKYATAAAVSLLVVSSVYINSLNSDLKEARNEIIAMESNQQRLAEDLNQVNYTNEKIQSGLDFLASAETKAVPLGGTDISKSSKAFVFWNPNTAEVRFRIADLPELPTDKQYQLWALKDGKPIDLGVFDVEEGLLAMKAIDGAQAFAVTLEPAGGSVNPTLDQMYLYGDV